MITIAPAEYIPFKRRVRKAFIGLGVLIIGMGIFFSFISVANNRATTNETSQPMPTKDKIELGIFIGAMVLILIGVTVMSQVKVLDSIEIDEKRKKIKVIMRKFDELVDKGEFDIDDRLKVKIGSRQAPGVAKTNNFTIKYGRKRIVSQNNSAFAGTPNWTGDMYFSVQNAVENIRRHNAT